MQKLKKFLSPRRLMIILSTLIIVLSISFVNEQSQSETQAIVTVMAMDIVDNQIELACSIITPTNEEASKSNLYSARADTIVEAVEIIGLQLGKDLGFSQCDIVAVGQTLVETGIDIGLDYLTRTKKVGKNVLLLKFDGKTTDFINASIYLKQDLSLELAQVLQYNKEYMLAVDSSIENFYLGFYSEAGLSIIPKIKLTEEPAIKGIKVVLENSTAGNEETVNQTGGDGSGEASGGEPKEMYLVNDGETIVLKNGKKILDLYPEDIQRLNLFIKDSRYGAMKVENVSDSIYKDATVVMEIEDKKSDLNFKFKNGKPVVQLSVSLYLKVEQIIEKDKNKKLLTREDQLLTDAVSEKVSEKIKDEINYSFDKMQSSNLDILNFYDSFNKFHYKKWQKYLNSLENKDEYLKGVEIEMDINVAQYL